MQRAAGLPQYVPERLRNSGTWRVSAQPKVLLELLSRQALYFAGFSVSHALLLFLFTLALLRCLRLRRRLLLSNFHLVSSSPFFLHALLITSFPILPFLILLLPSLPGLHSGKWKYSPHHSHCLLLSPYAPFFPFPNMQIETERGGGRHPRPRTGGEDDTAAANEILPSGAAALSPPRPPAPFACFSSFSPSIFLSVFLYLSSICLSMYLSVFPLCLSVYVCLSVFLSICLYVCLSVCCCFFLSLSVFVLIYLHPPLSVYLLFIYLFI